MARKTRRSTYRPRKPIKLSGKKIEVEPRDEGPAGWFV